MTAVAKVFLLLLQNKKSRNIIIGIVVGIIAFIFIMFYSMFSISNISESASIAIQEYNYWQNHSPSDNNLSCQGEKYCSYYNYSITDWCCFFAGYCYKEGGLYDSESGFSPSTNSWTSNLENMDKLRTADSGYSPTVGNPVFFNYDGRSNYATTKFVAHIGIVVEVTEDTITVIAGNEYNGATSNWANVSYVNKYTLSKDSDTIACYGTIGSSSVMVSSGLSSVARNVICHNEVGVLYDEISYNNYGSVIANDNGAISIGVYGWHGNKALSLLQRAYQNNSSQISSVATSYSSSGETVMNAIRYGANWSSYIPNQSVCSCIKAMLLTDAGIQAQDSTSLEDAQQYIDICTNNGLTDSRTIIYCCDILNQWGTSSFHTNVYGNGNHGVLYGVTGNMTLEEVYSSQRAWSDSNYNYYNRRTWTYNYLKNLPDKAFINITF